MRKLKWKQYGHMSFEDLECNSYNGCSRERHAANPPEVAKKFVPKEAQFSETFRFFLNIGAKTFFFCL